ncbi:hypothetical protein [Metabacillus fastidiosus]|uniref:Uncharacterized protein n=1 Tax=Metabacillus fastidiosus TaxID=1458 RepID=A0ABU6P412_9BACI|nr:hypothetical protein [Metabacillus fastidiosus]
MKKESIQYLLKDHGFKGSYDSDKTSDLFRFIDKVADWKEQLQLSYFSDLISILSDKLNLLGSIMFNNGGPIDHDRSLSRIDDVDYQIEANGLATDIWKIYRVN